MCRTNPTLCQGHMRSASSAGWRCISPYLGEAGLVPQGAARSGEAPRGLVDLLRVEVQRDWEERVPGLVGGLVVHRTGDALRHPHALGPGVVDGARLADR